MLTWANTVAGWWTSAAVSAPEFAELLSVQAGDEIFSENAA